MPRLTRQPAFLLGLLIVCVLVDYGFLYQLDKCEWDLEFGVTWPGTALPPGQRQHVLRMAYFWGTLAWIDAMVAGLILCMIARCVWRIYTRPRLQGFEVITLPPDR